MSLKHVTASEAKRLVDQGAVLIDVREAYEHAAEKIPGRTTRRCQPSAAVQNWAERQWWCSSASRVGARA